MSWFPCPICQQSNAPGSARCTSCGVDFTDPDVLAMASDPEALSDSEFEAGSLASGKFLGVSRQALANGSAIRKLGFFGALLILLGFIVPIAPDYGEHLMPWKVLPYSTPIPVLFPGLAVVMGLVACFAPLHAWQRSLTLLLAGFIGLGTLPYLGVFSGCPEKLLPVLWIGIIVASWGLILRCFDPQNQKARYLTIAGAVLAIAGFLIPMGNADTALPMELRFYLRSEIGTAMPLSVYKTVFNRDPLVFFSTVYLLLPIVLLPLGAALAWSKPIGVWDKTGLMLKPIAWLAALYVPLGFVLFAFNLLGSDGAYVLIEQRAIPWADFTDAALAGRLRMSLLAFGFAAWATLPVVAVFDRLVGRSPGEVPDEAPDEASDLAVSLPE